MSSTTSMTNNFPKVNKYLTDLEAVALKQAGKYVQKRYRDIVYSKVKKRTGELKRSVAYRLKGKTGSVDVGFRKKAWYGHFMEVSRFADTHGPIIGGIMKNDQASIKSIIDTAIGGMDSEDLAKRLIQAGGALPDESSD